MHVKVEYKVKWFTLGEIYREYNVCNKDCLLIIKDTFLSLNKKLQVVDCNGRGEKKI